ncbi:hypothetical protein [Kiloniella antarctica]|uniref:Uncharacterized protein n=1 Tax=Kiloniella antarctica TaxID=1550907 RepID=A0ABW5BJC0_9PROT
MIIKRHDNRNERERTLRHPEPNTFRDSIVEGVTEHLATMTYTPENLLQHLAIKLNQVEPIIEKSKTRFGRFINYFNGENPDYITIDGMVLIQLYDILETAHPLPIVAKYQYDVDPHDLKEFYNRAKKIVQTPSVKRRR